LYLPEADLGMAGIKPLVMVVNDDDGMREAMQFALQLEGAQVRLHERGPELLADPVLPACACLVLKYHLPGMDGFEVLQRVRERGLTMPVILLTSAATKALRARAAAAGVWLVLEKPIMDGALVNAVAGLLREIT
jgi:two-component system, LuxR family, response regulator FixJ